MNKITSLNRNFAVTAALGPADFAQAAALGFKAIISNLPDGESARHPSSGEAAKLAAAAGLAYRHIPATKFDVLSPRVVDGTIAAAQDFEGPILAHCASGLRSALAWGAAASRFQSADQVLAVLGKAGFNMGALRDELAELRQPGDAATPAPLKIEG